MLNMIDSKKIHFCGSILGRRQDAELYRDLILELEKYEIGQSIAMEKRVVCLYRNKNGTQKPLSAMISGAQEIECFEYETLDEAKNIIGNIGFI